MLRATIARRFTGTGSTRIIVLVAISLCLLYLITATARINVKDGKYGIHLKDHPTFNPFSDEDGDLVLRSNRNPTGSANRIDHNKLSEKIFNPTLLELPKGSKHDFVVITRQGQSPVEIEGKKYK